MYKVYGYIQNFPVVICFTPLEFLLLKYVNGLVSPQTMRETLKDDNFDYSYGADLDRIEDLLRVFKVDEIGT